MIKQEYIEVIGHSRNKKYYTNLGYNIEVKKPCLVKVTDLSKGSTSKVTTICENCSSECENIFKDYWNYTNGFKEPYYCNSCKKIKSEKTSLENWGYKNPMQSNIVKNRLRESIMDRYGVSWYSKTPDWLDKFKKTNLEKWGEDNPSKSSEVIELIKSRNGEFIRSSEFRSKSKDKKQRNTYKKYASQLPVGYSVKRYNSNVFDIEHDCGYNFSITKGLLYNRLKNNSIICTSCNPIDVKKSSFEIEVGLFLKEIDISFISNDRVELCGLELDYYIPDIRIAIECNGVYWHNELFKSKDYHINKTKECLDKGIGLLHIWEDDWLNKKDIIKSILKNRLGLTPNKIWARSCEIKKVSTKEYREFLEKNHIQGYSSSSYNIGLYYNEELVSLMTFGWRRTNNKREYELIRFCNKLNTNVIGSASKLFNYFIKSNNIEKIVSYSDISLFNGYLYGKLGFSKVSLSEPNYFWVVDGIRRHRYNFSKRKLVSQGYDPNKTEVEIMNDRGYWRVFSTGQEKWVYEIKKPTV
jgi:hypothetical protein